MERTLTSSLRTSWLIVLAVVSATAFAQNKPIPIAEIKRDKPVDFEKEILPIFKANCLACHNATKAKAKLSLEDPAAIRKGGETGPAVVPGKSAESLLMVGATLRDDPIMPPKGNKVKAKNLTSHELGLIAKWIDEGAEGEVTGITIPLEWQPLPAGLNPIYACALSPDGQFVACARANQIFVYHIPTKRLVTRLTDVNLIKAGLYKKAGASHHDVVHSLAFSPDGQLLASGGYRVVKLWRRPRNIQRFNVELGPKPDKNTKNAPQPVAVTPDGKWLATANNENTVQIRDAATGKVAKELKGHSKPVTALLFARDGSKLISASQDKTIHVWNAADGSLLGKVDAGAQINALTATAGVADFASGDTINLIRLWKLPAKAGESPTKVKQLAGHTLPITSLATLTADGKQIVSGSLDGSVRIWNIEKGSTVRTMMHGTSGGAVTSVAARPDSQRIASGGLNNTAILWNATNGQKIKDLKGDRYANERVVKLESHQKFTDAETKRWTGEFKKAEDAQKKAAEALVKSTTDKDAPLKAYAETEKAWLAAQTAKRSAATQLANANVIVASATEVKAAADLAFKDADAANKPFAAKVTQLKAVADKATADLNNKNNQMNQAKTVLDQAKVNADKKAKEAAAAKTAADQANADAAAKAKAAADAKVAADKAKAETAAKAKEAERAKAAGDAAKAQAKAKEAADAKARSDKANADAQARLNESNQAKSAAAQAKANLSKKTTEATQAKQVFAKATADFTNKQKAAAAAKPIAAKATAAYNAAKTIAGAATAKRTAAEKARNSATTQLTNAQKAQQAADAKVKATDKTIKDQTKTYTDALTKKKDAENKFHQSMLAARNTANKALETRDNMVRATREWNQAKKDLTEAQNAVSAALKPVRAVAFSTDTQTLAVAGDASTIHTYNAGNGDAVETYTAHEGAIASMTFSSGGDLITAAQDRRAIAWNAGAGWKLETTIGSGDRKSLIVDRVLALGFSPDGENLVTGGGRPSRDGEIRIWRTLDGRFIREIENAHNDTVFDVQFSYDGRFIASAAADKFVKVWHAGDGKLDRHYEGHTHHALGVSWNRNGRVLMSAGADNVIKIWNTLTGARLKNVTGFKKEITSIRYIGYSDNAIITSGDPIVRIYRESGSAVRSFSGYSGFMYCSDVTPDGTIAVAAGEKSILHVWNATNGQVIAKFEPPKEEAKTAKK